MASKAQCKAKKYQPRPRLQFLTGTSPSPVPLEPPKRMGYRSSLPVSQYSEQNLQRQPSHNCKEDICRYPEGSLGHFTARVRLPRERTRPRSQRCPSPAARARQQRAEQKRRRRPRPLRRQRAAPSPCAVPRRLPGSSRMPSAPCGGKPGAEGGRSSSTS